MSIPSPLSPAAATDCLIPIVTVSVMAFPPPHGFLQNYAMASLMQGQFPTLPMGGLVPLPPPNGLVPHPVGITVPTGVTSISAAPVRKIATPEYGFYPGLLPPPQPPVMSAPLEPVRTVPSGPSITVFIGSITDRASDILIRQMLSKCGNVNIWKRVQGANGKLQAFGYCDFADPESAMRAIRILHDFEIADKKLVVKADAKTQEKLDDYVRLKKTSSRSDDAHESLTKKEDEEIRNQIVTLLSEHEIELNRDPDPSKNGKKNGRNGTADAGKSENLADLEMEEEKRHLINREIDKFRDTYKEKEDEKDAEKDVRREDKKRDRRDRSPTAHDRLRDRNRKRDAPRDRRDRREPDSRSDHRDDSVDDEDTAERRKLERQLREKESSYQQRLRNWENREIRKEREFEDQKRREEEAQAEEAKEAKKLKIFLEDYDDDRDDSKYYRTSIMKSRLRERQKELEEEERDRRNEKRELDELRRRLSEEGHPDPDSEAAKRMNHKVHEKSVNEKIRELMVQARSKSQVREDSLSGLSDSSPKAGEELHVNPFSFAGKRAAATVAPSSSQTSSPERLKRNVPDIFNTNEDDESGSSRKRRKLPVLHEDDDSSSSRLLTSEEKKKQIKELISEIPTARDELFSFTIEWDFVDKSLMEKRIRPWINKKVTEFIGEQEEALVDFICSKLNSHSSAESILNEVVMILDDEAEVFIVKLWRLLIYEIKAKKAGLAK